VGDGTRTTLSDDGLLPEVGLVPDVGLSVQCAAVDPGTVGWVREGSLMPRV
jgi:hypothetical protein